MEQETIPPLVHNVKHAPDRARVARRVQEDSRFEWRLAANCTQLPRRKRWGCGRDWTFCELRSPCSRMAMG